MVFSSSSCVFFLLAQIAHGAPLTKRSSPDLVSAENYLHIFGYMTEAEEHANLAGSHEELIRPGLLRFQKFAGLSTTGVLDDATIKMLQAPRCGRSDSSAIKLPGAPDEITQKWPIETMTFYVENTSKDLPMNTVRYVLHEAFKEWSDITFVNFNEVSRAQGADLRISFVRRNHGDDWNFDGPGGILAHAFYPTDGRLHFDDDENWAYNDIYRIQTTRTHRDILQVAIHEIGHLIGLEHSSDRTAIMAPFYHVTTDASGRYTRPTLSHDDTTRIQAIYGDPADYVLKDADDEAE